MLIWQRGSVSSSISCLSAVRPRGSQFCQLRAQSANFLNPRGGFFHRRDSLRSAATKNEEPRRREVAKTEAKRGEQNVWREDGQDARKDHQASLLSATHSLRFCLRCFASSRLFIFCALLPATKIRAAGCGTEKTNKGLILGSFSGCQCSSERQRLQRIGRS